MIEPTGLRARKKARIAAAVHPEAVADADQAFAQLRHGARD